ncbi:hypothetical protein DCE79_12930 [Lysinibacillus sp. 2017]|uniref:hypothetical protein n=1 Tax=unclassified Lysinibacillus TaxID=2636778 RepID=UPI000D528DCC|nr:MULTISPECIES: hypothetical protein [unclassified Lysinibacillus]AWE08243.1 hypothetical protein DCE79_12930 [Lysinibacillus sp. 2017]TGN36254.1 hypothetical protein E4L99_05015 [Lysinibacillus sp. S2017]
MKLISYISIVFAVAFGLHGVITGDLKFQPIMYFFFGITFLMLAYGSYKKGEKRNVIAFTIPFLVGVIALIVMLYR